MDGLLSESAFADLCARAVDFERFTLFDVGCSGGLDPAFRRFGERLRAFAFDPDIEECARLRAAETLPGVRYENAYVAPPAGHSFLRQRQAEPVASRNVWFRLSGPVTVALRAKRQADLSPEQKRGLNLWNVGGALKLADPAAAVSLPEFARTRGIDDVDFIKIDVDGEDFVVLNDIAGSLESWGVLGLGLEVNFDGSEGATENSFHNTDRLMRAHGFDLFGLTVRRYSHAALPGIYAFDHPSETLTGRPQLGDAIYLRDLADPRHVELAAALGRAKLLKLAAIASLANVPDLAADVLLAHRQSLEPVLDVSQALDLLATQVQSDGASALDYTDYMAAFRADSPLLYRSKRRAAPAPAPEPELVAETAADVPAAPRKSNSRRHSALRALRRLWRGDTKSSAYAPSPSPPPNAPPSPPLAAAATAVAPPSRAERIAAPALPARPFAEILDIARGIEGWISDFSIQALDSMLSCQRSLGAAGSIVEFGCFKGKSASVLSAHVEGGERLVLVDPNPQISPATLELFRARPEIFAQTSEAFSGAAEVEALKSAVRFMHIDSSHSFDTTLVELAMAEAMLTPDGLVCIDDFYNPDYAQGLAAVYFHLFTKPSDLVLLLMTHDKGYLCRRAMFETYARFVLEDLIDAMRDRGCEYAYLSRTDRGPNYRAISMRHRRASESGERYQEQSYARLYAEP